ncbi:MAG TPA: hypothetical protein VLG50_04975 [Candidatus Saccharimonadales bacterium]|nr:hypothetical protein [Candidatus Saccharimonadales bacterium]
MKSFDQLKSDFYRNPSVNPYTQRKIKPNALTYNKLVIKFGDPTVIIPLNITHQIIPEDILYQILLYADDKEIKNLCHINQLADQLCRQNRWQIKFEQAQLPSYQGIYTLYEYLKMVDVKNEAEAIIYVITSGEFYHYHGSHFIISIHKKYYHINLPYGITIDGKKYTNDEFKSWLMKLIYDDVNMLIDGLPIRKKHLLKKKGYKTYVKILLSQYKKYEKQL